MSVDPTSVRPLLILHLSDIHAGQPTSEARQDQAQVLDLIIADAENFCRLLQQTPDLILITGDLAHAGKASDYEKFLKFIERLCSKLAVDLSVVRIVPGNHDIDRSIAEKTRVVHKGLRAYSDKGMGVLFDAEDEKGLAQRTQIWPKFNEFSKLSAKFGKCVIDAEHPFWTDSSSDGFGSNLGPIELIGLNTAIVCFDDLDWDDGKRQPNLAIGWTQINAIRQSGASTLRIILGHHPPNNLIDGENLNNVRADWPHLLLHGHMHHQDVLLGGSLAHYGTTTFKSGAAYLPLKEQIVKEQQKADYHAYQFIRLSREGVDWYPRELSPRATAFKSPIDGTRDHHDRLPGVGNYCRYLPSEDDPIQGKLGRFLRGTSRSLPPLQKNPSATPTPSSTSAINQPSTSSKIASSSNTPTPTQSQVSSSPAQTPQPPPAQTSPDPAPIEPKAPVIPPPDAMASTGPKRDTSVPHISAPDTQNRSRAIGYAVVVAIIACALGAIGIGLYLKAFDPIKPAVNPSANPTQTFAPTVAPANSPSAGEKPFTTPPATTCFPQVERLGNFRGAAGIVADADPDGYLYVASPAAGTITRISKRDGSAVTIAEKQKEPRAITFLDMGGKDSLWVGWANSAETSNTVGLKNLARSNSELTVVPQLEIEGTRLTPTPQSLILANERGDKPIQYIASLKNFKGANKLVLSKNNTDLGYPKGGSMVDSPCSLTMNQTHIFVGTRSNPEGGVVWAEPTGTSSGGKSLIWDLHFPYGLATARGNLYVADRGDVKPDSPANFNDPKSGQVWLYALKTDGSSEVMDKRRPIADRQNDARCIVADDNAVAWTNFGTPDQADGSVMIERFDGQGPTALANNQKNPEFLTMDSQCVYYTDKSGNVWHVRRARQQ